MTKATKAPKAEPSTELTIPERASRALGLATTEAALLELAGRSKDLTAITNDAAYEQVHAARMVLKNQRVEIERRGKMARDDATKFSKAVIAEEKRLIDLIEPEEKRLQALQKAHDDAIEQAKQAAIAAEAARVAAIQERIAKIRAWPTHAAGQSSAEIGARLALAEGYSIEGGGFEDFAEAARFELDAAKAALRKLHEAAVAHEAEQERIKAERAELDRLRAEDAARRERVAAEDKARAERIAAEDAALAARKAAIEEQERKAAPPPAAADCIHPGFDLGGVCTCCKEFYSAEHDRRDPPPGTVSAPVVPATVARDWRPTDRALAMAVAQQFNVDFAIADRWIRAYGADLQATG